MILPLLLAAAAPALAPALAPLAPLTGHCWVAELPEGMRDTHCFEAMYGGRFVRDRHVVARGAPVYEGETVYAADPAGGAAYTYWSSDGATLRGTMRADGPALDFGETVSRDSSGREVRMRVAWRLAEGGYEARWESADPRFRRTMRFVRADAAPTRSWTEPGPGGTVDLVHEAVVAATPAQVYAAVSTAEGWRGWAVRSAWDVAGDVPEMETSYDPAARQGDPRNIRHRILARVPDRLFVFRTVHAPPGFPDAELFYRVTQVLELEAVPGGTRVRLTGVGYPDTAEGRRLVAFFTDGNRVTMDALRRRFAAR